MEDPCRKWLNDINLESDVKPVGSRHQLPISPSSESSRRMSSTKPLSITSYAFALPFYICTGYVTNHLFSMNIFRTAAIIALGTLSS